MISIVTSYSPREKSYLEIMKNLILLVCCLLLTHDAVQAQQFSLGFLSEFSTQNNNTLKGYKLEFSTPISKKLELGVSFENSFGVKSVIINKSLPNEFSRNESTDNYQFTAYLLTTYTDSKNAKYKAGLGLGYADIFSYHSDLFQLAGGDYEMTWAVLSIPVYANYKVKSRWGMYFFIISKRYFNLTYGGRGSSAMLFRKELYGVSIGVGATFRVFNYKKLGY